MPNPEQPFLDPPCEVKISTDPGQTGRLATGGVPKLLEGQQEALKPSALESNFFGKEVLLTLRLGVDGQMEVIGSDLDTLNQIRQEDPNHQDIYLSIRIPPSKYSYYSLNVVAGRLDGTCPVNWDQDNANLYAPLWLAKAELELDLLHAANKHKPEAEVAMITSQTAGKVWDTTKPSTTSVGLNISQLVIWEAADLQPRDTVTENDRGFAIEGGLIRQFGPNYQELVHALNQADVSPHGVIEYILRTARPRGWQAEFEAKPQLLAANRLAHVTTYLDQITSWVNDPRVEAAYEKTRDRVPQLTNKLNPPVQPSFGEVLILTPEGKIERLIIPVPGYAMGNMERLGVDLQRDLKVKSRMKDDQSPINHFYDAVSVDLKSNYSVGQKQ